VRRSARPLLPITTPVRGVSASAKSTSTASVSTDPALAQLELIGEESANHSGRELWLALSERDDNKRTRLCQIAQAFSSQVSVEAPDGVLLEAGRSRQYFGGLKRLLMRLQQRCQQAQIESQWGVAPTPLAALALARVMPGKMVLQRAQLVSTLTSLPLIALGWSERTLERLAAIGVRDIGAALRLPRAEFSRRYGRSCLASLDRLVGRQADPRRRLSPALRFRLQRSFDFELRDTTLILRELQPMLQELEHFLRRQQRAIECLQVRLQHRTRSIQETPSSTVLRATLAQASAHAEPFVRWFTERLARERLPDTVVGLELRVAEFLPMTTQSENLWRPGEHGGAMGRESPALIERLRARLGHESVYGLCLVDEHRPECAYRVAEPTLATADLRALSSSFIGTENRVAPTATTSMLLPRRPLWLLHEPQPLPWCWRQLQWLSGPERIETGWWDGRDVMRDYYHALDPQGAEVWVFRERQPPHAWYLHGVFG
jgi:protein ImuB